MEPGAVLLGGVSADLAIGAGWLDAALDRVPGLQRETGSPAAITVRGELAGVTPDPNLRGAVYLDDFDATETRFLSATASSWVRGSRLAIRDGAESVLPPILDESNYAELAWQHNWIIQSANGDSLGIFERIEPEHPQIAATREAFAEVKAEVARGR